MKSLNETQISYISEEIEKHGVTHESLKKSLLDHICTAIEQAPTHDFEEAYASVLNSFGENGLLKIQKETIRIIHLKKTEKMKKTMYVIGFFAAFICICGILFKTMHWQGASIMLVVGAVLLNLGFLPLYFYNKYKESVAE